MIQLQPGESFPITYQLDDPSDTGTYYVRAVVRNVSSDATIDTVTLTDMGDQRFTGSWRVSGDVQGLGFYVSVTIKVYTDSGYTTLSTKYAITQEQYLVQDRFAKLGGGVVVGPDIDYKRMRKIFQEELEKLPQPDFSKIIRPLDNRISELGQLIKQLPKEEALEPIFISLSSLAQHMVDLKVAISNIRIPEPEKIDFAPIFQKIEESKTEPADLSPVLETMKNFDAVSAQQTMDGILQRIRNFFDDDMESLNKKIDAILEEKKNTQMVILKQKPEADEKE